MTTLLASSYNQLVIMMTSWFIKVVPMADSNPFKANCGGIEPFAPTIVTAVNYALGAVDTIAVVLIIIDIMRWMFSKASLHLKSVGITIIGLILVNGAAINFVGAFGFGLGCLGK